MEGLHVALNRAIQSGIFKGVKIGNQQYPLSHLFFADDAIYIGEWSVENILNLINILSCFEKIAGLKVSLDKSALFGIGVNSITVQAIANTIGCKGEKFPTCFLGIPIGLNMRRKKSWDPLINKFKKKLSSWKARSLSIGGRHTLVNCVLGSLGTYWFSLFAAPKGVLKSMEDIRRKFFWGETSEEKAIPWVRWTEAMRPREEGGLGINSLKHLNQALIAKWAWRFVREDKAIWVNILKSLYGNYCLNIDSSDAGFNSNWIEMLKNLKDPDIRKLIRKKMWQRGRHTFLEGSLDRRSTPYGEIPSSFQSGGREELFGGGPFFKPRV